MFLEMTVCGIRFLNPVWRRPALSAYGIEFERLVI